ncbi:MAG: hypothetical protein AAGD96_09075 [Chloroflexota bacterium]
MLFEKQWGMWQRKQPNATFIEMSDVGHMIPLEDYETLADHVLDWLKPE